MSEKKEKEEKKKTIVPLEIINKADAETISKLVIIKCSICNNKQDLTTTEENVIKQWVCKRCLKKIINTGGMQGLMLRIPININIKPIEKKEEKPSQ
jgi:hypothetical protein